MKIKSRSSIALQNTFGLFENNQYHVDKLFKKLVHKLENQLGTVDYKTVFGSYPSRWQNWNKSMAPLHFIYRKRFSPVNVTILNVLPFNIPLWRLAIKFLYNLCRKRHPKILFVGNPKFYPLSTVVNNFLHQDFNLFYIRAVDHWIPGFAGNIRSMFLPHTPTQKGDIRDIRGVRLKNVRNHRGQFYQRPLEYDTYKFMFNYFYPECFILLNSSGRAYNADKEVLKKGIPTIALCSSDTKSFAFSGCFFTIPAGVNYQDHLYYYVFMFYVIIAYARSEFLYKECLSLQTNAFKPYRHLSQTQNVPSYGKLIKRFVETYQKAVDIYDAKIRYLEYTQMVEEDSDMLNNETEEDILLRKWKKWGIERQFEAETRKYKSAMVYNNFSGREAVIKSEHLKRSPQLRSYDAMSDSLNLISNAFKNVVSIILLQYVYIHGVAFIDKHPRGLENQILLFRDSPGCRSIERLFKIVKREKIILDEDFSGILPPTVEFFSKNLTFFDSFSKYKNLVFSNMRQYFRKEKKDVKTIRDTIRLTAVNNSKGKVAASHALIKKGISSGITSLFGLVNVKLERRFKTAKPVTERAKMEHQYQKYLRGLKIQEHRKRKNPNYVSNRDPGKINFWDTLPSYVHDYDKEHVVFHNSRKTSGNSRYNNKKKFIK